MPMVPNEISKFWYKNHKNKVAYREVVVTAVRFGTSDYYHKPQWLVKGLDLDKNEYREFAVARMRTRRDDSP